MKRELKINMKINIQKSEERGKANHGWLDTRFSFSFADYYNPERIQFGALRVLNEDWIEPASGFPMHSHANMEIVTIILEGALKHTDSMGNKGVIKEGEVQRMSAGTGVTHSEFNASESEKVHLLQIWVHPRSQGIESSYDQRSFPVEKRKNILLPIISDEGSTMSMNQDAQFLLGNLEKGSTIKHIVKNRKRGVYVFIIQGRVSIGEEILNQGDAAEITEATQIELKIEEEAHVLVIEVPVEQA